MDSLLLLCARRVVAQRPLPTLPPVLYPVLFQAAFLDERPLVLQDLVATWPFPVLHVQQLLGHLDLSLFLPRLKCVRAIIQGVVAHLQRELEEPGRYSSLRILNMSMLPESESCHTVIGMKLWCRTNDLAKACVEVSKHLEEFQKRRSKHHKGCSRANTATAALQCPGVDIYTDLCVSKSSYRLLRDALQTGATGLLRLKCCKFNADNISASEIVTLLESLDPSCLRRVDLCFNNFGLARLSVILAHLSRFPELRSLKLEHNNVDVRNLTLKTLMRTRSVAQRLGMLPSLRELNLGSSRLSGNLHQILCELQSPLESLELPFCGLLPADLAFLSQSIHAPALKRLDLSSNNISQGLLEPLQLLLEEASASLLYLNLMNCHVDDSHLNALLPTLLRCSRLRFLGLRMNPLSMAALKDLLQKTLELPELHHVVYPIPKDCYKRGSPGFLCNFMGEELFSAASEEISQLLAIPLEPTSSELMFL
ncbi:leucine-rich repeat-containing protein 14-like [Oenanthe melanoleuca]|uniref:leucine-rich repeat-containing protein 14-like n=1 Tax=Oenanthe melanoleuca TaxID=2939378 RepID=UPI0024C19504|nr:leucine-rich repeat-containing protein 14-like [Oenanthe melanoleuca]XP_056371592.1 leucine-rich repeat-containing protein 14-like [Oenanthe melanoleuca]XP_056371593.1 leucine-rich repeat-containing protein 14-like [Oenanthe melanoleuca]